jgi:hypothetical protein
VPVAVGLSSSDCGGVEAPFKRACPWCFLSASTQYVCGAEFRGMPFPLAAFWIPGFEGNIGWNDRGHISLVLVVLRRSAVALATKVSGVGGAPQDIIGTEMSGASASRSAATYLPSSSNSVSPPINWRWVESEVELMCSQVTTTELLLC